MILQAIFYLIEIIVWIVWVQAETGLELGTNMKIVLRMELTMPTVLPISSNLTIRTSNWVVIHIGLKSCQNPLKCLHCHSHTQVLLKLLNHLHHFQLPFHHCQRRTTLLTLFCQWIWGDLMLLGIFLLHLQKRMAVSGNWTCCIYVFLQTFVFLCSLTISFYVSFTNLFSITCFLIC